MGFQIDRNWFPREMGLKQNHGDCRRIAVVCVRIDVNRQIQSSNSESLLAKFFCL